MLIKCSILFFPCHSYLTVGKQLISVTYVTYSVVTQCWLGCLFHRLVSRVNVTIHNNFLEVDGWVVFNYQHCDMVRLCMVCVCVCVYIYILCIPTKVHNFCISQHQPFTTLPPPTFILNFQPVLQISQPIHWGPTNNPSGSPPSLSSQYPYHPYLYNIHHLLAWLLFLECLTVKTKELWPFEKSRIIYQTTQCKCQTVLLLEPHILQYVYVCPRCVSVEKKTD